MMKLLQNQRSGGTLKCVPRRRASTIFFALLICGVHRHCACECVRACVCVCVCVRVFACICWATQNMFPSMIQEVVNNITKTKKVTEDHAEPTKAKEEHAAPTTCSSSASASSQLPAGPASRFLFSYALLRCSPPNNHHHHDHHHALLRCLPPLRICLLLYPTPTIPRATFPFEF